MSLIDNLRGSSAVKNIINLYSSQLVSVGFSILISLYIPKFIGIEEFSYWQLFLFYANYTGFLQLGLNDGIYLRFGGKSLTSEECSAISSQLWITTGLICILCLLGILFISTDIIPLLQHTYDKFIFSSVAIFAIINNVFGYCGSTLQAINRFKVYTNSFIIERLIMGIFLLIMVFLTIKNFEYIVVCWTLSLLVVTIILLIKNKDIFLRHIVIKFNIFKEIGTNIRIGINLMLSNISGMLIIGICRFFISKHYPIEIFGYVSFSLSLCLFCLLFISKIGIGIYPLLKRKSEVFYRIFFIKIDFLLTVLMPLCILFFPIFNLIVKYLLPNYYPSLTYLAIFFPLCIFTAKIDMLYSTYLKVLRQERYLLKINILIMLLSVILSAIGIYLLDNLILTLICVNICIILKAYFMQQHIRKTFALRPLSLAMLSDAIISIVYLTFIAFCINLNVLIFIILGLCVVNVLVQRHSIKDNIRFLFITRQ